MGVLVGSARFTENGDSGWNGKAKAGDQTGKEVSSQSWYLHSKGWILLRALDEVIADKIAEAMEKAIANNLIGYDQSERATLYAEAKKYSFDPSKVTIKVETDCSALVRVCILYAGVEVSNFTTATEVNAIMATGKFEKLTADKYTKKSDNLKRGDILVTKTSGHTVVVLNDGAETVKAKEKEKKYFKIPKKLTVSIVDALVSIGEKHTFEYRKTIAIANGIKEYKGTAAQNGKLVSLLFLGKLIRPEG